MTTFPTALSSDRFRARIVMNDPSNQADVKPFSRYILAMALPQPGDDRSFPIELLDDQKGYAFNLSHELLTTDFEDNVDRSFELTIEMVAEDTITVVRSFVLKDAELAVFALSPLTYMESVPNRIMWTINYRDISVTDHASGKTYDWTEMFYWGNP